MHRNHTTWLKRHKHLRYMWIPYTDTVVVVTNDPLPEGAAPPTAPEVSERHANAPFYALAKDATPLTGVCACHIAFSTHASIAAPYSVLS